MKFSELSIINVLQEWLMLRYSKSLLKFIFRNLFFIRYAFSSFLRVILGFIFPIFHSQSLGNYRSKGQSLEIGRVASWDGNEIKYCAQLPKKLVTCVQLASVECISHTSDLSSFLIFTKILCLGFHTSCSLCDILQSPLLAASCLPLVSLWKRSKNSSSLS